jgi:pimeloyl-ACP methyl ester carboxylesterase
MLRSTPLPRATPARPGYHFARLTPADEPAIALHLLSLDVEDRALRFGHPARDEVIASYVRGLNFNRDVAEGAWDAGRLVGFAHLAVYPENGYAVGELGISIRIEARGRQVGSRLLQSAIVRARRYGLVRLYIHYMRRNSGMTRLARRFSSEITYTGDEALATLAITAPESSVFTEMRRVGENDEIELFRRQAMGSARGHVLFVHGAGGDGWQWRKLMAQVAMEGFDAYALSLSGHGTSVFGEPSLDRYRGDLEAVLATLPEDTRLVGHSLGGYLVQDVLTRQTRPSAVLLAPVPANVPRGDDLAHMVAGLEGQQARDVATRLLPDAPTLASERIDTPITLISGDLDRVLPVPWMHAVAEQYRAPWTRLNAGHNLPIANGVAGPLLVGLVQ